MRKTTFQLFILCLLPNLIYGQTDTLRLKYFTLSDYYTINSAGLFSDIDFYNSNEVTLYRQLRSDEISAKNGVLKIINNVRYEYILLPKRNIGHYYATYSANSIRISFDARNPNKSFSFDLKGASNGYKLYFLTTTEQNGEFGIDYDGEFYNILSGPGFTKDGVSSVYLLFDNIMEIQKETTDDTLKSYKSRRQN